MTSATFCNVRIIFFMSMTLFWFVLYICQVLLATGKSNPRHWGGGGGGWISPTPGPEEPLKSPVQALPHMFGMSRTGVNLFMHNVQNHQKCFRTLHCKNGTTFKVFLTILQQHAYKIDWTLIEPSIYSSKKSVPNS